ncbi:unnamed protein product [Blepharisma stoltei]|uniref:Uncharacterized protein n=1 Tax=Blepharisma stoltei TaxID=1481888 RepID=A0AAU9IAK2_9CILI|nr:unnamed protein product [Blepharisma stoltei]
MGCNLACVQPEHLYGPVDLVYEDQRLFLNKRPRDYNELFRVIMNFISDVKTPQDIILEYSGPEGINSIIHDLSLQEAYILSTNQKLVIGIRLSWSCQSRLSSPFHSLMYSYSPTLQSNLTKKTV